MARTNRIIALDVGASKVVLAEFAVSRDGAPELTNYGIGYLGIQMDSETDPSAYVVSTIRDLMRERNIKSAPLVMSISGQMVFPRYVKLPPVSRDKLMQMINYEAEQNVPFPIDEVVWDYQLIGDTGSGEQNVVLVAVKIENVTSLTDCVVAAGLEPEVVDVAPMALYNAVRYNYPDIESCTMILDIGARSSNVVFIEGNRVFFRSIPVAGNAITNELMKEFELSFKDAEALKLTHAFVAFGGVYAGPESEVADRVSKIVRNVITRLHAEVNRSINFYRSQQGGNPPSLVLLTGGSSIMPHLDTFFREKLNVEVEYLNPFVNVSVSDRIDADKVGEQLHLLGEVVGVALRRSLTCPVELNLMPPDLVAKKVLRRRQPFFALSAIGLVLIMLCWWVYVYRMHDVVGTRTVNLEEKIADLTVLSSKLQATKAEQEKAKQRVDSILGVTTLRTQWLEMIEAIHSCMLEGVWLKSLTPVVDNGKITRITIEGVGFNDKLDLAKTAEKTPVEVILERLRNGDHFTTDTAISAQPDPGPNAFAREFTISVGLKKPIQMR